jgi:hypothetical protein
MRLRRESLFLYGVLSESAGGSSSAMEGDCTSQANRAKINGPAK